MLSEPPAGAWTVIHRTIVIKRELQIYTLEGDQESCSQDMPTGLGLVLTGADVGNNYREKHVAANERGQVGRTAGDGILAAIAPFMFACMAPPRVLPIATEARL